MLGGGGGSLPCDVVLRLRVLFSFANCSHLAQEKRDGCFTSTLILFLLLWRCGFRNFCQGGGGGGGSKPDCQKTALTTFFFVLFSPQLILILQRVANGYFKKTIIFQGFRGGPTCSRKVKLFPGGGGGGGGGGQNAYFYKSPYNL